MHSECLLEIKGDTRIDVQVRFLQLVSVEVKRDCRDGADQGIESRDEGIERSLEFALTLPTDWHSVAFNFPAGAETELLVKPAGRGAERVNRAQHELTGTVSVASERISDGVMKLAIEVTNETRSSRDALDRNSALLRSLLSAHTILSVNGAQFVSLLDPPDHLRDAASACKNIGNLPVLVGNAGERDMLLCSPIVLYDYPQIAPESSGDFYDATEIDEMLTLRVMTLSDKEKEEMRASDDRVRDLLQRTEEREREQLMRTHGTIRGLRPSTPPRRESA
jgi:hypothetical protein